MVTQCNISTQEDHNTKFFLIILLFRIRNVFFFQRAHPPLPHYKNQTNKR